MVTANALTVLLPQLLSADTVTDPPVAPAVTVMLFVVDVPVHPDGNIHEYAVAPETAATEYVWLVPAHAVVLPVMAAGCVGTVQVPHVDTHAAALIVLVIRSNGCGPNPLLKLIPTPERRWQ
jgi:hypothetical protein